LTISEFEPPAQLAFAEMSRLDQVGALGGVSAERQQTLRRQEEVLIARYGTNPFRHLAQTDPDSILPERRFRWQAGLPWDGFRPDAGKGRKRTGRRS
jgi:hypothetical protein